MRLKRECKKSKLISNAGADTDTSACLAAMTATILTLLHQTAPLRFGKTRYKGSVRSASAYEKIPAVQASQKSRMTID
jgi:hypothetical protein